MNTREGRAWHTLAGARGVGPKTLWLIADYLASRNKTASWLLEHPGEIKTALSGSNSAGVLPDFKNNESEEMSKRESKALTVLHPFHPGFPQQLKNLKDILALPALLYVTGNTAILNRTAVALVGKRNASAEAKKVADSLAGELVAQGVNITSGYAAGIDSAAHLAALRAGGTTSIVLAEGIVHFRIKPELREFSREDNMLVISQFEPEAKWAAYMAMTRNKLVCALSGAVVVIVSDPENNANGRHSGTFNAGISALKMGIPVFAVSPNFFVDNPQGNRELIQKGCLELDPASGTVPILAALHSHADKKPLPSQLNLFEKICE